MNVVGPIGGCWIPIQYEKLLNYCAHGGMLEHGTKDCPLLFNLLMQRMVHWLDFNMEAGCDLRDL